MTLATMPQEHPLPRSLAERLEPARSALLVVDMQNDFCAEGGYVEAVVGKSAAPCRAVVTPIARLAEDARAAGVPVYWVRANYDPSTLPAGMAARFAERGAAVCCAPGSWGAEFFGVAPAPGEPVVEKHCYSAFVGTDLAERLRARRVRTVVLAGVQTNVCIESTLRDAHSLGFNVAVAEDCVASHTPELHAATLANVRFIFGDVLSGARIAALWQGGA
jgi:ureidoacrylate peracid hydrolase